MLGQTAGDSQRRRKESSESRISIALKPGANVVLIKIANDNLDGWGIYLQVGGADKGLATTR